MEKNPPPGVATFKVALLVGDDFSGKFAGDLKKRRFGERPIPSLV